MNGLSDYTPTQKIQKMSSSEEGEFPVGALLLERYEIIHKKEGGMGIVYIVRDNKRKWDYAVKTLNIPLNLEHKGEKQFFAEIEHLINLSPHVNIVQIDFIEFINDKPYIFMEYIDGTDLYEELRISKKLDFDLAIDYALQICEGMRFIHEKGRILHLDIKPRNILITNKGIIKISDFGISKPSLLLSRRKTSQGAGTHLYMSPEQINGETVDIWSDIYSFGIVFYEMLAGKLPYPFDIHSIADEKIFKQRLLEFHKTDYDFHNQFSHREIIEGLPFPKIGTIIGHCLAKLPSSRVVDFCYLQKWIERDFNKKREQPVSGHEVNFHRKGINLQAIKKHSKALECFNHALTMNPSNAVLWNDAANSLSALEMEKEEKMFRSRASQLSATI